MTQTLPIDLKDLMIRTLPTPNPFALKFVANAPFKEEGKATFNSPLECEELPLVRDLFAISVPGLWASAPPSALIRAAGVWYVEAMARAWDCAMATDPATLFA